MAKDKWLETPTGEKPMAPVQLAAGESGPSASVPGESDQARHLRLTLEELDKAMAEIEKQFRNPTRTNPVRNLINGWRGKIKAALNPRL